jgi:nicotinamide-nucleotide amidase
VAGPADATLARLTARVARKLCRDGQLMVTAESCTGGFLAKTLTDRAGSSECYDRGWVTYSNNAKHAQLGVRLSDIKRHGAVSRTVALAMVRGAFRHSKAAVAVAVTGVAGPTGGTASKPVGTVWIAWGFRGRGRKHLVARRFLFRGGRDAVRRRTVAEALKGLLNP